jgi:hypothetical protein
MSDDAAPVSASKNQRNRGRKNRNRQNQSQSSNSSSSPKPHDVANTFAATPRMSTTSPPPMPSSPGRSGKSGDVDTSLQWGTSQAMLMEKFSQVGFVNRACRFCLNHSSLPATDYAC